jgi:arsenate reductase-like glutaredoxin family protein
MKKKKADPLLIKIKGWFFIIGGMFAFYLSWFNAPLLGLAMMLWIAAAIILAVMGLHMGDKEMAKIGAVLSVFLLAIAVFAGALIIVFLPMLTAGIILLRYAKTIQVIQQEEVICNMNIQIFGRAKCHDTRAAERYFKERGIKFQLIDMNQKGLSKGELNSVINSIGIHVLVSDKHPDYTLFTYLVPEAKVDKLVEVPGLLTTPIVRNGKSATVGYRPDVWDEWRKVKE